MLFQPTLYNECNYLSMRGLKLNHVSERCYWLLLHQQRFGRIYIRAWISNYTHIKKMRSNYSSPSLWHHVCDSLFATTLVLFEKIRQTGLNGDFNMVLMSANQCSILKSLILRSNREPCRPFLPMFNHVVTTGIIASRRAFFALLNLLLWEIDVI